MADSNASLGKLDAATSSRIRSTQILTSLPHIASELVQNALDAGAKQVEVGVHFDEWACWVKDDGCGITKDGLAQIAKGIEGGRYSSSKAYGLVSLDSVETFGFRGEALASAADLSCMEIASRAARSKDTWSVIMKGGEKLYHGPSLRWRRERAGTTVSVRDAFYNLPIRRSSHPGTSRTIELVRKEIEATALVHPHVSFTLQDASKGGNDGADKSRVLTIPKTSSSLAAFRHLYGRALVERVEEVNAKSEGITIVGFLSLVGSHAKSHQFLYVNRHILDHCQLHRVIEEKFAKSAFSKYAMDEAGENATTRPGTRRSPRKGDRRPVYVLNLSVSSREVDNCLDPAKRAIQLQNNDDAVSFLADVIESFLKRHGFTTPAAGKAGSDANHEKPDRKKKKADAYGHQSELTRNPQQNVTSQSSCFFARQASKEIYVQENREQLEQEEISWTDPTSGRVYLIDPRTGNSYLQSPQLNNSTWKDSRYLAGRRTLIHPLDAHSHSCDDSAKENQMPDWIKSALEANKVFAATDAGIQAYQNNTSTNSPSEGFHLTHRKTGKGHSRNTNAVSLKHQVESQEVPIGSFSKEDLANAQVIAQIDCKFIACLIRSGSGEEINGDIDQSKKTAGSEEEANASIVLVDQHAADERIRVERYLKSICLGFLDCDGVGVERRLLDPPIPVLLTRTERDRLTASKKLKRAFLDWGFCVCDDPEDEGSSITDNNDGYGIISFKGVPEVVADKLLVNDAENLREVVKGYLARLEADLSDASSEASKRNLQCSSVSASAADEFTWLRALRFCPQELIELVNSRACRGAIMFNDRLSDAQCRWLILRLASTAFPFQCAHGRPSVVPVISLGTLRNSSSQTKRSDPKPIDWQSLG